MKTIKIEQSSLQECISQAQEDHLIVTRDGRPVALVIGIDEEQLELVQDASFWKLIEERRGEKSITRNELEEYWPRE
jgi:antitoxin (DNA-binding transcriptional repressor) of toxin-antitoxin stability system